MFHVEHFEPTKAPPPHLRPITRDGFGYDQARHLLWRAGFGGTPEQIETLAAWGPEKAVDHLLDYESVPYGDPAPDEYDRNIVSPLSRNDRSRLRRARQNGDEETVAEFRRQRQQRQRRDRAQMRDIQRAWLKRMIETPRPLEEKMTLFWHDHFATSYRTIENSYHSYMQNNLLRAHAVGSFADLLRAIIRDPAMIVYLDNNDSRKDSPNENLARELMELFSLGVGNYTEDDIKEGARSLTGYTFRDDEFVFRAGNHDNSSKSILGKRGNFDGEDFVSIILEQRACSRFISAKLYDHFCAATPLVRRRMDPTARKVIDGMAGLMLKHDYGVKPVLRKLFLSQHFYHPRIMLEQIKSPVTLAVGAVRSLGVPIRSLDTLNDALDLMGQDLFFPPSVKGWDGGRTWINTSTLYVRQNLLAFLLTGRLPAGSRGQGDTSLYDPRALLSPLGEADAGAIDDPARVIDYMLRFTLGRVTPTAQRTLTAFVDEHGGEITEPIVTGLLLLITAMPEYQLC